MQNNLKYIIGFVLLTILLFGIWYFKTVVFFILISTVLSLVLRPVFNLLCRLHLNGIRLNKGIGALLTVILMWLMVSSFVSFVVPFVVSEIQYLSSVDFSKIIEGFDNLLQKALMPVEEVVPDVANSPMLKFQLNEFLISVFDISRLQIILSSLFEFLGRTFIAFFSVSFITFFLLKDEWILMESLKLVVREQHHSKVEHIMYSIKNLLRRYFIGILLQIGLITIIVTGGMLVMGLAFNHAVVIGLFAGVMNIIPYLGPLIGAAFGFLVSIVVVYQQGLDVQILWFVAGVAIVFMVVQILDNVVFQPVIFSSSVKAHPLEIFLVIILAGFATGILGMFLAIPVYTIIRVIAKEFFSKYNVVRKLTGRLD